MIINTITQIRDKMTNATQDQIEFEGWKRIIKTILNNNHDRIR